MKKILFVACMNSNEITGLNLFMNHPYGQVDGVRWEIIIGNGYFTKSFKKEKLLIEEEYSAIYEIRTTNEIDTQYPPRDCIYIEEASNTNLTQCNYLSTPLVLISPSNEKTNSNGKKHTFTLRYQKTNDYFQDANRIRNDFYNIIYQTIPPIYKKEIYLLSQTITQELCDLNHIKPQLLKYLSEEEKMKLRLPPKEEFLWDILGEDDKHYAIYRRTQQIVHVKNQA